MQTRPFSIVDVFARGKYTGNQLAVVRQAGDLSGDEMLAITREMNYSETTFILSDQPRDGGYDVRIFTPGEEVDFAGHPTLGTAYVIRQALLGRPVQQIVLNLKIGRIPVTFSEDGDELWMKQIAPRFGAKYQPEAVAPLLGLDPAELDHRFPIQEVSTGLPFLIVPLRERASLTRIKVAPDYYLKLNGGDWARAMLAFCPQPADPANDLAVRVFVGYYGVPEDPATGSGNGCLAGYLVRRRYFGSGPIDLRVEQGAEINRPSLLLLRAAKGERQIDIHVGGRVELIAEGTLY